MRHRHAMTFLMITLLLDTLGLGLIIPVMPALLVELTGQPVADAAGWGGWLMFVYALMTFLFAPLLGNLSDRFGRRPILLGSLLAMAIDYVFMALAGTITLLFIGRLIAGAVGATFATANAYVADVTPPEQRAARFGLLGAAWGIGFALGPAVGGLLGDLGTRMPFYAAAALAVTNLVYGVIVLPETLAPEHRRSFSLLRANPVGALLRIRRFPLLVGFFLVYVFHQIAHDANPSVWSFYLIEKFDWSGSQIGLSLMLIGVSLAVCQALLVPIVVPRIGERWTVVCGMSLMAAGFLAWSLAPAGWMMLALIVPWCMGAAGMPALRSLMTAQVPPDSQGELQGAVSSVVGLSAIVAPLLMTQTFRMYSDDVGLYFPGAPFALAAAMLALALLTFLMTTGPRPRPTR